MSLDEANTEELLGRAGAGDDHALSMILDRYRDRLRRMVAVRIDRRILARVDASDVAQEALAEAARRLAEYLDKRPAPFYLWVRQLALQRLAGLSRRHIGAQRRSVKHEVRWTTDLPNDSVTMLADRLASSGTAPSAQLQKRELRDAVQSALALLASADREILVLRYLEQLSTDEIASVLSITSRASRARHRRALERLGELLEDIR